jgi:Ser/Thr protein kinase RdoA (MazF antagonist)
MLSQVYGNNVHLVTTKAVGKAVIDGEPYGMVAISPARGINMQTLFINIVRLPQESSERLLALHIAQKGVEKLGTALAEFHQIHTQKEMPLDTTIFERMNHEISKIEKHLIQKNICIERSDIQHYAAYLIDQVKTIKTTRALIHGDAHLGNFVYDMDTDTVYMVDYNEIGRSVDKDGNPIGNAAMDVMNLLDIIAANKQFGLTPQEITILTEGFIKGYGTLPSKIEQDFFLLLFRIGFLSWFLKAEEEHPEQFKDSPLKKLSCYLIDEIKHSLVYFKAQEARDCCFA